MKRKYQIMTLHRIFFMVLAMIHINADQNSLAASVTEVKIHYLGHAAFVLQFDHGITIVTDYGNYNAYAQWGWSSPIHDIGTLIPDIMTYSHSHQDHYDEKRIPKGVKHKIVGGTAAISPRTLKGIELKSVRTCETTLGAEDNTSFIFHYNGLTIVHLGDATANIKSINNDTVKTQLKTAFPKDIDLLFMTIQGKSKFIPEAELFIDAIKPKVVIPMHHWSQSYLEEFIVYLKQQNEKGKNYKITQIDRPKYSLLNIKKSPKEFIQVVSLRREKF